MWTKSIGKVLKLALLLSGSLILANCATPTVGKGLTGEAVCTQLRPVHWSKKDTDQTIRQNKANNAVGEAICGW